MQNFDEFMEVVRKIRKSCPWDKVQTHESLKPYLISETNELLEGIDRLKTQNDSENLCEELGDVLFSAVNIARFLKVDAEDSLNASTEKFINRFCKVEQLAQQQGIDLEQTSVEQMEQLWKQAKNQ